MAANCLWILKPSHFFIIFSLAFITTNQIVSIYGEPYKLMSLDTMKQLVQNDAIRHTSLTHKMSNSPRIIIRSSNIASIRNNVLLETEEDTSNVKHAVISVNQSVIMRMRSAADEGVSQYVVPFKAGTPSQQFTLFVDTGSDLTWMNCKYGCNKNGDDPVKCSMRNSVNRRVFLADNSSSFSRVPCSSDMCKVELADEFSLALCPSPLAACAYDYRYNDGSSAQGIFANETITVSLTNGRKTHLHNILIGCSNSASGPSFKGQTAADGVLGLGYSNASFTLQLSQWFGGKFSYCLVDHLSDKNVSSYLIFGPASANKRTSTTMRYTTLGVISSFYALNVGGISVNGIMLNIPREVWNVNGAGGTIIDSGTSLTSLTSPAYEPVVAALQVSLAKFEQLHMQIQPFRYCFNSSGFNDILDAPKLVFHFDDGARFEPLVKSFLIDVDKGVKCLGFVSSAWPGPSVLGNIMQQNYLWEFDLIQGVVGFAPSSCT